MSDINVDVVVKFFIFEAAVKRLHLSKNKACLSKTVQRI